MAVSIINVDFLVKIALRKGSLLVWCQYFDAGWQQFEACQAQGRSLRCPSRPKARVLIRSLRDLCQLLQCFYRHRRYQAFT